MPVKKPSIQTFGDLIVYQNLYKVMKIILQEIIPGLPKEERFDLADQMRRAAKAGPALIAEGFAKRYQKNYWKKYINDTIGECNEMIHHLSICIDIYPGYVDLNKCREAIATYVIVCKQLTRLGQSWQNFHERHS
jgi:four helix bundle protein